MFNRPCIHNAVAAIHIILASYATAQIDDLPVSEEKVSNFHFVPDTLPFEPNVFTGSFQLKVVSSEHRKTSAILSFWLKQDMTTCRLEAKDPVSGSIGMTTMHDLKGKWSYVMITTPSGKNIARKSKKEVVVVNDSLMRITPLVTVTDKRRKINGHFCTNVVIESEEGTCTAWVALDLKNPFSDLMRSSLWNETNETFAYLIAKQDGFPLEWETRTQEGSLRTVFNVTNLVLGKVDERAFSMDGYLLLENPSEYVPHH